jgi:hydroxymethylbilane synthase
MQNSPYRLIVSVNLDRHEILVAGGGVVGERKIGTLLAAGAVVKLISPEATESLCALSAKSSITWERRVVERDDFKGRSFAVLALPVDALSAVAAIAREENCVIDACGDGSAGDFALCAQFEMDGCYVGVSSGGNDPARAAALKRAIKAHDHCAPNDTPMVTIPLSKIVPESCRIFGVEAPDEFMPLTVLTRNSPLALVQADTCIEALAEVGVNALCRTVTSHGDRDRKRDLAEFGGFGAFVKALEEDLLARRGDFAVHSMKDVPVNLPDGCVVAAVLPRYSVYDVLITRDGGGLESLPSGAIVGTSSLRRKAQVRGVRRDVECVTCRGNVETRLGKLERGEVDALILAEAGLNRLGINLRGVTRLPFITAAGQGAVAIETLAGTQAEVIARRLNHFVTSCEITAERELLRLMGLGCACPIGVLGEMIDGVMDLAVALYSIGPKDDPEDECVTIGISGRVDSEEDAVALASRLWEELRDVPLMTELLVSGGLMRWV